MWYIPPVSACLNSRLNQYQKYLPPSTRSMHTYNSSHRTSFCVSMHTAHVCRNLVNVKSEPNTWLVKTLQYVLSSFEILFTACSLSYLVPPFFSELPSAAFSTHFCTQLSQTKTHTLWRPNCTVLPFLHHQENLCNVPVYKKININSLITNKQKDKP